MTAAPTATTGWSVNRRAAKAVVLHARDHDDARLLLDMLGLVDGPHGREILPDDTRLHVVTDMNGLPIGEAPPPRTAPDEPPARGVTTPPGLAVLPPVAEKPKQLRSSSSSERKPRTTTPRARKQRKTAACGTPSGAVRHAKRGEPVCEPCREARNAAQRTYDAARRARVAAAAAELTRQLQHPPQPTVDTAGPQPAAERPASLRPGLVPIELDQWFAAAQRSPHRSVGRAAARAITALVQLRIAMDDLARAERATTKEPTP
jgi:hypothetical protein